MQVGTETEHTDCSHHCKDLKEKEWNVLLLLPKIKKEFLFLFIEQTPHAKEATVVQVISEGWAMPHCSKAEARETKKIDLSSCKR